MKTPIEELENWLYFIGITYSDSRDLRDALFQVIQRLKPVERQSLESFYNSGAIDMKNGIVNGIQPDATKHFNKVYEKKVCDNNNG